MPKGKELTISQKQLILSLWKDGNSYKTISSNTNIPFTTIGSFITRYKNRNTLKTKDGQVLLGRFLQDWQGKRTPDSTNSTGYPKRAAVTSVYVRDKCNQANNK